MKLKHILLLAPTILFYQCNTKQSNNTENNATSHKILVPIQANQFEWIYKPNGDYFFGPDNDNLKEGEWYDNWVPNDHAFIKGEDGKWHIFGITHPEV